MRPILGEFIQYRLVDREGWCMKTELLEAKSTLEYQRELVIAATYPLREYGRASTLLRRLDAAIEDIDAAINYIPEALGGEPLDD